MPKRKIAAVQTVPPETAAEDENREVQTLTLDGTNYHLCFDLDELAEAEAAFQAKGHRVNLLACLPPSLDLQGARILFAAAVHKRQPELKYEAACALVTRRTLPRVIQAFHTAFVGQSKD